MTTWAWGSRTGRADAPRSASGVVIRGGDYPGIESGALFLRAGTALAHTLVDGRPIELDYRPSFGV